MLAVINHIQVRQYYCTTIDRSTPAKRGCDAICSRRMFYLALPALFVVLTITVAQSPNRNETNISTTPNPAVVDDHHLVISPRFLQFSIWAPAKWLSSGNSGRMMAIIENIPSGGETAWQLLLELRVAQPDQRTPFTRLLNNANGSALQVEGMPECDEMTNEEETEQQHRMDLEMELSADSLFVRGKNAMRYALPSSLSGSHDLLVFFVYQDAQHDEICHLHSEMETRETSKFMLPPTSPTLRSTSTPASTTTPRPPPAPTPLIRQWPYKRKRVKSPRRGVAAAQRLLSPAHYVTRPSATRPFIHQQRLWLTSPFSALPSTTTQPTYIDIIRDRHLYEEVQRSRTNEINSRWSTTFFVFGFLIAVLITLTGSFALLMSLMLQWRPKTTQTTTLTSPQKRIYCIPPPSRRGKAGSSGIIF